MKLNIAAAITLLAAAATAAPANSAEENWNPHDAQVWYKCVDTFLDSSQGMIGGTAAACKFWDCIDKAAISQGRGGALAIFSAPFNTACAGVATFV